MAAFSYRLTFAGVPFLLDEAAVFRMNQEHHPSEVTEQQPIRRYQPEADLIDELNRVIPFQYLNDFAPVPAFTGKNLDALAWSNEGNASPLPTVRIGDWYYPTGCSRWSVFRMLASSSQVKEMLRVTGGSANPSRCDAATFHVECKPQGALNANFVYAIDTSMFMLPPRPLNEHGNKFDGLYLVTLVDERYLYRSLPVTLLPQLGTSWQGLINQIQQVIPAYPITLESAVQAVYQAPALDSQLWTQWESLGVLLDVVAANIGRVPVRRFDGSIRLYTFTESQAKAATNRGNAATVIRTAGGDIFQSGSTLAAGNLTSAKNAVVPNFVDVSFPKYVIGDDPVPHFLDARYQSPRRSMWFEDSFGSVFTEKVPIASGGVNVSGLTGVGEISVRDTAKAFISGEVAVSGTPINVSGLRSLAMQIAQDYYNSQAAVALDEVFPGTVSWDPDGINDVVWTYSARARGAYTRVLRGASWSRVLREFQHESPASSGYNYGQKGVGGHGVAQTIRDSFGSSGTFTGLSGVSISGSSLSGSLFPQFSGGVFSGSVSTTLSQTLLSGQFVARFTGISHFPTQNRWWGTLPVSSGTAETILFEGTSGGVAGAYSGNFVQIVARGQFGTIQRQHNAGAFVKQVLPDAGYGINLTTYEKGQFIYPSDWTSGGVQGVNIVPQTQTVRAGTGTGVTVSGTVYYSGRVLVFDPTQPLASAWVPTDRVWVTERNNNALTSGTLYDGQFLGYGPAVSGVMTPSPVYAASVGGGGGTNYVLSIQDSFLSSGSSGVGINWANTTVVFSGTDNVTRPTYTTQILGSLPSGMGLVSGTSLSGQSVVYLQNVSFFPTENRWRGLVYLSGAAGSGGNREVVLFEGTSGGVSSGTPGIGGYVTIVQRGLEGTTQIALSGNPFVSYRSPDLWSGVNQITYQESQFVYPGLGSGGTSEMRIVPQTQTVFVLSASGVSMTSGFIYYSGRIVYYEPDEQYNFPKWTNKNRYVWVFDRYYVPAVVSGFPRILSGRIYPGELVGYSPAVSGRAASAPVYAVSPMPENYWVGINTLPDTPSSLPSGGRDTSYPFFGETPMLPITSPNLGYGLFNEEGTGDGSVGFTQLGMMFAEPGVNDSLGKNIGIGGLSIWGQAIKGYKRYTEGCWSTTYDVGSLLSSGLNISRSVPIHSITNTNPAVVTTDTLHGFSTGDYVLINLIENMPGINGRMYAITVTSTSQFTLNGANFSSGVGYTGVGFGGWAIKAASGTGQISAGASYTAISSGSDVGARIKTYAGGSQKANFDITANGSSRTISYKAITPSFGSTDIWTVTGVVNGDSSMTIGDTNVGWLFSANTGGHGITMYATSLTGGFIDAVTAAGIIGGNFYAGLYTGGGLSVAALSSGITGSLP